MDTPQELKTDAMNSESKYTSCPYNSSHRILRARMQYHLVKCKRSVKEKPEDEKSICPFDATHHVNKEDFEAHVQTCPNRKIIDSEKYAIESEDKPEEEPAAAYSLPDLPPCEENWDDPNEPTYTYDPTAHLENQPILRTMHGATKSERKAFRQVERMKMIQFNSGQPMDTNAAASAVGVAIANGKFIGRGRGQNRLPLGRGNSLGAVGGSPVDLDKLVGDGVGHIVPCPVEAGPLRQPRGASLALMMARKGEDAPAREEVRPPSPSTGAIRKVRQPPVQPEESSDREEKPPARHGRPQDNIDWWEQGDQERGMETAGRRPTTSQVLEEYKEQTRNAQIAAKLGSLPMDDKSDNKRDDDDRARDFTYKDDEWQIQGRRGRVSRGGGFPRRGKGRNC